MTSLFERVRRLYLRATTYPAPTPQWSTKTATCAGCGKSVVLGEPHYTMVRSVERVEADGTVSPLDGDEMGFVHLDCWPGDRVVINVRVGLPEWTRLRRRGDEAVA